MNELLHPAATEHLPSFITAPGGTDVLMVVMSIILVLSVLVFGSLFFRLHTLPERMAHRSHKLQFEIVAVLGLLALFTHIHLFWVAGLLLAMIDIPDFGALAQQDRGIDREDRRARAGRRRRGRAERDNVEDKGDDGATTRREGASNGRTLQQGKGSGPCLRFFSALW